MRVEPTASSSALRHGVIATAAPSIIAASLMVVAFPRLAVRPRAQLHSPRSNGRLSGTRARRGWSPASRGSGRLPRCGCCPVKTTVLSAAVVVRTEDMQAVR